MGVCRRGCKGVVVLTDKEIEEISAREKVASNGPWEHRVMNFGSPLQMVLAKGLSIHTQRREDAEFIAHSRTDVVKLLEEVKRLRAREKHAIEMVTVTRRYRDDPYDELYEYSLDYEYDGVGCDEEI